MVRPVHKVNLGSIKSIYLYKDSDKLRFKIIGKNTVPLVQFQNRWNIEAKASLISITRIYMMTLNGWVKLFLPKQTYTWPFCKDTSINNSGVQPVLWAHPNLPFTTISTLVLTDFLEIMINFLYTIQTKRKLVDSPITLSAVLAF